MKKPFRAITLLLFAILSISAFGQFTGKPDSSLLARELKQIKQMANANPDSAMTCIRKQLLPRLRNHPGPDAWEIQLVKSELLDRAGKKDSCRLTLNLVYEQACQQNDTSYQLKSLNALGNYYQQYLQFEPAVKTLLKAQQLITANTPVEQAFHTLIGLGNTHRRMQDYTKAFRYFHEIESQYANRMTADERFSLFVCTGNVYLDQKDLKTAERYYLKAYNEAQKTDSPFDAATINYNLAALYAKQKKNDQAEVFLTRAMTNFEKLGDKRSLEHCYRTLASIRYQQRRYADAEPLYLKALDLSNQIKAPKSILGNYKNLYQTYYYWAESSNDAAMFKKSFEYQRKWADLKDSVYQTDLSNQILELETKYETDKKNAQIELLAKDNQLKIEEIYIEQQQRRYMFVVNILLLAVTLIVVYFGWYYRKVNRRLKLQSQTIWAQKEQISAQNTELQKAINTRDKLFSIIAHDLRSPLVSISNFVNLLQFYLRDKKFDAIERMATDMSRKNEQVLQLTDNLLNWAHSQSGGLKPKIKPIPLNPILNECYELYQPVAERKHIGLHLDPNGEHSILADPDMMRTICRNLVNNALKFTPEHGRITIRVTESDGQVWVHVSDTGLGIAAEKLGRLFMPHKEDVRPGTAGEKSTGLGLMLCKEFTDVMKGEIKVESEVDRGSTFSFSVPAGN